VVLDYRLHEREEALKWYQESIDHDEDISNWNYLWSPERRIRELTSARTRHAPGEPLPESPPAKTPGQPAP
jgi:hypothetical protein